MEGRHLELGVVTSQSATSDPKKNYALLCGRHFDLSHAGIYWS